MPDAAEHQAAKVLKHLFAAKKHISSWKASWRILYTENPMADGALSPAPEIGDGVQTRREPTPTAHLYDCRQWS